MPRYACLAQFLRRIRNNLYLNQSMPKGITMGKYSYRAAFKSNFFYFLTRGMPMRDTMEKAGLPRRPPRFLPLPAAAYPRFQIARVLEDGHHALLEGDDLPRAGVAGGPRLALLNLKRPKPPNLNRPPALKLLGQRLQKLFHGNLGLGLREAGNAGHSGD
jgi:hypothetical protein